MGTEEERTTNIQQHTSNVLHTAGPLVRRLQGRHPGTGVSFQTDKGICLSIP